MKSPRCGGLALLALRVLLVVLGSADAAAADIGRLMGWGVDGLVSDDPARVRAVLTQRGVVLPAPLAR